MGIGFLLESTGLLLLALALGKSCSHASRRAALWFGAIAALPLLWLADITGVGWQPLTQPGPATLTAAGSATTAPVSSWWTLWIFYCAISAWRLAIWLRALWASHALRLQSRPCRGTAWLRQSRLLSRALHRRTVPVLVHADIASPFMVGGLYPRIYIPVYLERCEPQRARQVLLHEFAHLRARDWLRDQLIALVCCVLWFQPLIHRVRAHFRRDIELACDAQVLRAGTDALDYAHTLLHCAERHQRLRAALVAIADQRGQLVQRVAHILEPSAPCASAGLPWAQAALLFGGLLLVSVNLAPRML